MPTRCISNSGLGSISNRYFFGWWNSRCWTRWCDTSS